MNFFEELKTQKILPVLRYDNEDTCFEVAKALHGGGFKYIEVTLTNPNPYSIIEKLAKAGVKVGAGTVLNKVHVIECASAGAEFLVSPGFNMEIVDAARMRNLPYVPGVATPTEVMDAVNVNLEYLKLFPAGSMGGVAAVKNLKAPFPNIHFIPTGGIQPDQIQDFLNAGAFALGLSPRFISDDSIQAKDWKSIEKQAKEFLSSI